MDAFKWPDSNISSLVKAKNTRDRAAKLKKKMKEGTDTKANKSTRQWLANPGYRFGSFFEAEPTTGRNRARQGQYSKPDKALF